MSSPETAVPEVPGASPALVLTADLGRDAHTVVHRARRGDAEYAVKVLHRLPADPVAAARAFRREAALLAGVDHPALVPRHEVGELDGRPYLVMDLVDGHRVAVAA